ncbi:hypothetical protein [Paracoccus tibetensis]|uniref:Uncharacterized protein involved in exopolysaccharide biosynthesis n=1 Tax=Paracoccus tibetensis TaxID=336292 RepID=A0A1G5GQF5_9RHOB|nr:hypothetical protein [Paracoccus tibetensis]SCY53641.1 Uncharacterized protein involved in exopolysaccharide biosynthesis [Paracoccus tibetensis]
MGPIVGVKEFIDMLRRRGPVIALILMAGLYLTITHALSLARSYEAVTVIQIEPNILGGGLAGESSGDTAARLRLIEQRLMARSNVLDMIDRFDLFDDAPELNEDTRVTAFRQGTRIEFVPAAGGGPGSDRELSAMLITVRAGDGATAANLANDMADQIMRSDQETRNRRLDDLIETLQREDDRITTAIRQVQVQAEAFRRQNADSLPENTEYLVGELTRLESQRVELTRAQQALERELLAVEVGTAATAGGRSLSVVQQLRTLEVDLAQARLTLPEDHPEVQRLAAAIEDVREGQVRQMTPGAARQVELIRSQSQDLDAERAAIDQRVPQIEAQLAAIPTTSVRLDNYATQIATLEVSRATIAERLSRAELDKRLASSEHGDRMVVLERASRPEYPVSAGRKRVAVLGLAASLAAALAAAFLLEMRRPLLRTPAQLQKALGVAPIAVSALRPSRAQRRRARLRDLTSATIVTLGVIAIGMLMLSSGSA